MNVLFLYDLATDGDRSLIYFHVYQNFNIQKMCQIFSRTLHSFKSIILDRVVAIFGRYKCYAEVYITVDSLADSGQKDPLYVDKNLFLVTSDR